jgi:hypothetical protein
MLQGQHVLDHTSKWATTVRVSIHMISRFGPEVIRLPSVFSCDMYSLRVLAFPSLGSPSFVN